MPNKLHEGSSKSSSQPSNKFSTSTSNKSRKSTGPKSVPPRRTIPPIKTLSITSKDSKCATSTASGFEKSKVLKPKKTTKSDVCCSRNMITKVINHKCLDYCKKCGDTVLITTADTNEDKIIDKEERKKHMVKDSNSTGHKFSNKSKSGTHITSQNGTIPTNNEISPSKTPMQKPSMCRNPEKIVQVIKKPSRSVQQYYRNENFQQISDSVYDIGNEMRKVSLLDTIKEIPEVATCVEDESSSLESTLIRIIDQPDREQQLEFDDYDTLKKLKLFRDDNYFECHNAKSRIRTKGSVTSLDDHKCTYRFYLNERLFPVPLNMDHNQSIRCVECHLPLELSKNSLASNRSINGTIQAKVRIGSAEESQDTLVMLPVKDSLIIREKRRERQREADEPDIVYFGIIKLDAYGHSVFNKTLPDNSLALRYQKGYKQFETSPDEHKFQRLEEGDVVHV